MAISKYTSSKGDYTHLSTSTNEDYQRVLARADLKLLLIPIVFIFLRCWGTIRYFISMSPECFPPHPYCNDCMWSEKCYKMLYDPPVLLFLQVCVGLLMGVYIGIE